MLGPVFGACVLQLRGIFLLATVFETLGAGLLGDRQRGYCAASHVLV